MPVRPSVSFIAPLRPGAPGQMALTKNTVDVFCGDMEGTFHLDSSLVMVGGGIVPLTSNNFERLAGKTSNKWRDMIKVRCPGAKKSPSLREWASKHKVSLGDPDVEEAISHCHIPYEDERVPLYGVGGPTAVEEGWVAVEDSAIGGFAIGYIWRNEQGDMMFISVHPEPTSKRGPSGQPKPKKKKGEKEPRARLFTPAMQRWFPLGGDLLPHPERLELLTHPQAMPTLVQAPRELVAALQKKLDDAECGAQDDLRLEDLSADIKRQIKVARDKEGRSEGSIRVSGPVTKYADDSDLSKDGFLRRPEAVARAILSLITARDAEDDAAAPGPAFGPAEAAPAASVGGPSASFAAMSHPQRQRQRQQQQNQQAPEGQPQHHHHHQYQMQQQQQQLMQQQYQQQVFGQQQFQQPQPLSACVQQWVPQPTQPQLQWQWQQQQQQQQHPQQHQVGGCREECVAETTTAWPAGLAQDLPRALSPSLVGTSDGGPGYNNAAERGAVPLGAQQRAATAPAAPAPSPPAVAGSPFDMLTASPGDWANWGESAEVRAAAPAAPRPAETPRCCDAPAFAPAALAECCAAEAPLCLPPPAAALHGMAATLDAAADIAGHLVVKEYADHTDEQLEELALQAAAHLNAINVALEARKRKTALAAAAGLAAAPAGGWACQAPPLPAPCAKRLRVL